MSRSSQYCEDLHFVCSSGPQQSQLAKLDVPKKTKVFVDQTVREREHAICKYCSIIHITFTIFLICSNASKIPTASSSIEIRSSSYV